MEANWNRRRTFLHLSSPAEDIASYDSGLSLSNIRDGFLPNEVLIYTFELILSDDDMVGSPLHPATIPISNSGASSQLLRVAALLELWRMYGALIGG